MRKLKLGTSDIEVSELCYGTDFLGSTLDRETSFRLLDTFRECGGNFLDTANFYASWVPGFRGGESETMVGVWMKERGIRHEIAVGTKLGFDYPGCDGGLSAAEIQRECDKSLRRLQTDFIDIYYAHRDDLATPIEETMEAFDRLVRAGKVRAIGASNLRVWRIAEANHTSRLHGWASYVAIEQRHTYLRPRHGSDFGPQIPINDDLKDYCRSHCITPIAYSVLLKGAYTRPDRAIPPHYQGPEADERLAALHAVARETGATPNQVVIAWIRQGEAPMLPIIAGRRPEQIIENAGALNLRLTPEQMKRLDTAGNPHIEQAWIQ